MIDLNDYFYFVQVVEKNGFTAAAQKLNMPKSRLSRHVRNLEERLDTRLIQRTSRQFNVTDMGTLFYQHARSVIDEMELAESVMMQQKSVLSGSVSVSCSVGVAEFALKELLVDFLKLNPKVSVVQQVTNQHVDLIANGIDMAVRGHVKPLSDSTLIQRHLANVNWHLFASPSYLDEYGVPNSPYDLFKQKAIKVGWQPLEAYWNLENHEGVKTTVPYTAIFASDDMGTLKQAAVSGLGIVALPAYACREEIKQGQLTRILPNWHAGAAQLTLLLPSRKGIPAQVIALRDYLLNSVDDFLNG
ncbi:LysR substrate-binding domain-containing protein [Sessilibacter corallicola]|uniref:LysR substrate-binding domain-containing protein n=1 Tax=Sessilibacter corallicola TaxID=2904075 RepID=UPI001E42FE27|nr:LysR substrate-binding domain-containing protein [Sessilibacter corallicola]MCE2029828.1 LysR substrate-binding domain-containing protein [Sessilibacter corallicola]